MSRILIPTEQRVEAIERLAQSAGNLAQAYSTLTGAGVPSTHAAVRELAEAIAASAAFSSALVRSLAPTETADASAHE